MMNLQLTFLNTAGSSTFVNVCKFSEKYRDTNGWGAPNMPWPPLPGGDKTKKNKNIYSLTFFIYNLLKSPFV